MTLPPDSTKTYTFHVSLAPSVPVSKTAPLIAFEAYIDQINPASGSGATLADTYATDIKVPTAASSNIAWYVWALLAAGAITLTILGVLYWHRHRSNPQGPPGQAVTP